jgi:hypothetical protein
MNLELTSGEIEQIKANKQAFMQFCKQLREYLLNQNRFPEAMKFEEFCNYFNKLFVEIAKGNSGDVEIRSRVDFVYNIKPPKTTRNKLTDGIKSQIRALFVEFGEASPNEINDAYLRYLTKQTVVHVEELSWRLR